MVKSITLIRKVLKIHNTLKVVPHLPSNLCFRKSKSAFCIISVTCVQTHEDQKGDFYLKDLLMGNICISTASSQETTKMCSLSWGADDIYACIKKWNEQTAVQNSKINHDICFKPSHSLIFRWCMLTHLSRWFLGWWLFFSVSNFKPCSIFETAMLYPEGCCLGNSAWRWWLLFSDKPTSPLTCCLRSDALVTMSKYTHAHHRDWGRPTSYPLSDGPTKTTGLMEGTTSYGGMCSACNIKAI